MRLVLIYWGLISNIKTALKLAISKAVTLPLCWLDTLRDVLVQEQTPARPLQW